MKRAITTRQSVNPHPAKLQPDRLERLRLLFKGTSHPTRAIIVKPVDARSRAKTNINAPLHGG